MSRSNAEAFREGLSRNQHGLCYDLPFLRARQYFNEFQSEQTGESRSLASDTFLVHHHAFPADTLGIQVIQHGRIAGGLDAVQKAVGL